MGRVIAAEPFDKFWIDCQTNNLLTLLTTVNPKYEMAGALNDFVYKQGGRSGWFKVPVVEYGLTLIMALCLVQKQDYVFQTEDIIQELIDRLDEKRLISIEVDLFDWNPHNIIFHNNHVNHMSMLIGYDSDKRELYFNDAEKGEKLLAKTYEEFMNAVVLYDGKPYAFENVVPKEIPDFNYHYDDVRKKARCMVNNINNLRYQTYISTFLQPDFIHIHVNNTQKMYHRHVANEYLVEVLHRDGYINDSDFAFLQELGNDLSERWKKIKNSLVKMSLTKRPFKFEKMNLFVDETWEKEQAFWEKLAAGFEFEDTVNPEKYYDIVCSFADVERIEKREIENNIRNISGIELDCIEKKSVEEPFDVLRFFMTVKLKFSGVSGSLRCVGEGMPFVIYTDAEAYTDPNYVKSYEIEGSDVILHTEIPICDIGVTDVFKLCTDSRCSIIDDNGNSIPFFDHMLLGGYKAETPFLNIVEQSEIIVPEKNISEYEPEDYCGKYSNKYFYDYMIPLTEKQLEYGDKETAVFNRFRFRSDEEYRMRAIFGYQADTKIWLNGECVGKLKEKNTSAPVIMYNVDFTAQKGENEILVLTGSAGGTSKGFVVQLQRTDVGICHGLNEVYTHRMPEALLYEKDKKIDGVLGN